MSIYTTYISHLSSSQPEIRSLSEMVDLIRSDKYGTPIAGIRKEPSHSKQNRLKYETLPAFKPCVLLDGTKSFDDKSTPTGLVQLEFDIQDNPCKTEQELIDKVQKLREVLISIPEVIYCFSSPSGGLKFALKTDFTKKPDEHPYSLKSRFKEAYSLCEALVLGQFKFVADNSLSSISQSCYLSHDPDAYYNPDCKTLLINDQCKFLEPKIKANLSDTVPSCQIEELLSFIPKTFKYHERLTINLSVLYFMGESGVSVLLNHWSKQDKVKLKNQLFSQLKTCQYGSVGTLVNEAKKHGYKPAHHTTKSKLDTGDFNHEFEKLHDIDEANNLLTASIDTFFDDKKSMFINVSTGFGKTKGVLDALKKIPPTKQVLLLVPSHKLAKEIITEFNTWQDNVSRIDKFRKTGRMVHIEGKDRLCTETQYTKPFTDAKVPAPSSICEQCPKYNFSNCQYIEQFGTLANIRVMTHWELINEQANWYFGKSGGDGSKPRRGNRKPDYIIVDENWINHDQQEATLETEHRSIREVINYCLAGNEIADAIKKFEYQIIEDFAAAKNVRYPKFSSNDQYVKACKRASNQREDIDILEAFNNFLMNHDNTEIQRMTIFNNDKKKGLKFLNLKQIAKRHADVPTLYLDATANEELVKEIIGDIEIISIKVKSKPDANVYQASNFNITSGWIEDESNLTKLIDVIKPYHKRYKKIGLITYDKRNNKKGFDEWLAKKCGIDICAHFGAIRGLNQFKDVDCLLVVGRFLMPQDVIQDYAQSIYGTRIDRAYSYLLSPVRKKDGGCDALNNRVFNDSRLELVKKHFCRSETIQAIGRARLIHPDKENDKPKDIFLFSQESLGGDVEITDYFYHEELTKPHHETLKSETKLENAISKLNTVGYCRNNKGELIELFDSISFVNNKRAEIDKAFLDAGIKKYLMPYTKRKRWVYYVYDMAKWEEHVTSLGGNIDNMGEV